MSVRDATEKGTRLTNLAKEALQRGNDKRDTRVKHVDLERKRLKEQYDKDLQVVNQNFDAAQKQVTDFADNAHSSRSQYVAAKRRRTEPSERDLGEASGLQVEEDLDPDGAFLDDRLLHMEWWDSVEYGAVLKE